MPHNVQDQNTANPESHWDTDHGNPRGMNSPIQALRNSVRQKLLSSAVDKEGQRHGGASEPPMHRNPAPHPGWNGAASPRWTFFAVMSLNTRGFPESSAGKESACNEGDLGLIPGLGRASGEGKGYPLQYTGLENSMDGIVHGVAKHWTRLSDFHFYHH